jgi:hypothetical protein
VQTIRKSELQAPSSRVIPLKASHTQALAGVLSRAFYEEPYFTYMVPDENERRSVLPGFLNAILDVSRLDGESYTTPDVEGGAVWISPDHTSTFERSVRARLRSTNFTLSTPSFRRCVRLSTRLEQVREQLSRSPHWYLIALGLDPTNERASIRPALLQPVLSRADAEGSYCYLETLQERSLSFYDAQGFRIEGCGRITQSGPRFWAMIRAPQ